MTIDEIIELFQKLVSTDLPNTAISIIFLYFAVARPIRNRMRTVSAYIRRYLAICRQQARATETLGKAVKSLVDRRESARK